MENPCVNFIIKLGGSAVTDKKNFETVKIPNIHHAGSILLKAWQLGQKFIIVHGAGSFGHHHAKQYSVKHGFQSPEASQSSEVKKGFGLTRLSVCKLNHIMTEELCSVGLPVIALSPAGSWTTDNGDVITYNTDIIKDFVQSGFIPVLHGDAVLDVAHGCTILSGDTIIKTLCEQLSPERVIFVSDVDGIYDKPPSDPGSNLIPIIKVNKTGEIETVIRTEINSMDVTGGMKLKLQSSIDIVKNSKGHIPVIVCGLLTKAFENVCLYGELQTEKATLITLNKGGSV